MRFLSLLAVGFAVAGCSQTSQQAEYMTPAERTARMQAVAAIMATRPLQSAPLNTGYQIPTRQTVQTNCMQNGVYTSCTSY